MAISCYSSGTTVRDVDPSSVGMMEGAFFVSRTELLDWVNTNFNLSLTKVEQAASGAVYLQIVDALYGGNACVVPMAKVKWNCKYDYEYIQNYKLLQAVFTKQGIKKHIEVDRLIKGKYQDNLEFLQWLKAFYDRQAPAQLQQRALHSKPYNALERRKLAGSVFPEWAQPSEGCSTAAAAGAGADAATAAGTPPAPVANRHEGSTRNACVRGRYQSGTAGAAAHTPALVRCSSSQGSPAAAAGQHAVPSTRVHKQQHGLSSGGETGFSGSSSSDSNSSGSHHQGGEAAGQQQLLHQLQEEVKQLKELAVKLETEGEQAWLEREFYFRKLRRLEIMCTTPGAVALSTKEILAVLYATDDEAETQATAADETFAAADPPHCTDAQKEQEEHGEPMRSASSSTSSSDIRNVSSSGTAVDAAAAAARASAAAAACTTA